MATPEQIELEYQKAVERENAAYEEAKKNIQERKRINQENIDDILNDPLKKLKEERKKRIASLKKIKLKAKFENKKARRKRIQNLLKNTARNLVPTVTSLLTDKIAEIVAQNNTIQELIDATNDVITKANESNDPNKLNDAKIIRDNALKVIQDNESKITNIQKGIQNISTYITIFNTIVNTIGPTILPIPTPSPSPDVVTPPKERFRLRIYEPAVRILNGLNDYLPSITSVFDKAVEILKDLKSQLLNINNQLETSAILGNNSDLNAMNDPGSNFGTFPTEYKGFTFAIREEQSPNAPVIRGNKRHYAVAINTNKVEVLKSELSFTLDPNDLIDQLKIIIDRENLIA